MSNAPRVPYPVENSTLSAVALAAERSLSYPGIWLECGPLEGLVYGRFDPAIARANHEVFFHHQRSDGYLPCYVWREKPGTAQIQMVVPIAATALETADLLQDEASLANAYQAGARWDEWLRLNRDSRGTGLCELFCQFDSGHDGRPRHAGLPEECPDGNAAFWTPYPLPSIAADDPTFVRDLPENSWGGASQPLSALRARACLHAADESVDG